MKVYLSLLFTLYASTILAQNAVVEGITYDREDKTPLGFASVSIYKLPDSALISGVISKENGHFKLENLQAGNYFVKVRFVGFESYESVAFNLKQAERKNLGNLNLQINQRFLNEVKITGQQVQNINKIDKQVYKADQFVIAKGGTAIDVIKNTPSVVVDGQGEITMRGSKGFLVLINGKPVQTDAQTILSQLPANVVEDIELITAPSAKYDPDGKGGIINIITKKGADDGLAFAVNAQGGLPSTKDFANKEAQQRYGADATLSFRKDRWDLSASANYLRNDNAGFRDGDVYTIIGDKKTSFPSKGERSFDKYNYGGRFNVAYTPSKNNLFSAGFFASHKFQDRLADIYYDNVNTQISTGQTIGQKRYFNSNLQNKQGDFILGNLDYTHIFANKSSLSFSVLYEHAKLYGSTKNQNIEVTDTIQNTLSTYKNPLNGFRGKIDYVINIGSGKLETGYQYRRDQQNGKFIYSVKEIGDADFEIIPQFTGDVKAINQIHSVYTQYSGKANKVEYSGGLRFEHATRDLEVISGGSNTYQLSLDNLFPSANILYSLDNNWKLKSGVSRRVQRTNNFELNPIPEREHSETLEQGDANLLPEFIYLAEVGIIKNYNKGSFFTTVYYQDIKNPIQRVNSVYADTILNRVFTNAEKARRLGVEIGSNYGLTDWIQVYLGTNIYKSTINGVILNYQNNLKNSDWVYSVNANTNFKASSTFSIQANLNYLSNRPTVQGEDSRFLSPNLSLKKQFLKGRLTAVCQWQNIDLGLLNSNEQRITTYGPDFYTTTNYIYEKDVLMLNFSFNLNNVVRKIKLPGSEFGEREF